ncbi:methyltransferase domain-containing protein [bacterium]|nr:MAG: methyltransferase domain-containing protein [bacterium]
MKRLLLLLALAPAVALAAPKPDGTERQTARPWTGGVDIFETPGREQELKLPSVFRVLGIKSGKKVADVGAGGGWLSIRMARAVGPSGTVYAQDILPKYTQFIDERARYEGLPNIKTVLGTVTDPKLPTNTLDSVVILNAYHEFDQPLAMLTKIKRAMKTGARLGIIERDTDELRLEAQQAYEESGEILRRVGEQDDQNDLTDDHTLALDIVQREAEKVGFRFISSHELGNDKYLAVFQK